MPQAVKPSRASAQHPPTPEPPAPAACSCAAGALPEWVPEGSAADPRFAARVMPGVEGAARARHRPAKRRNLSVDDYVSGILAGERSVLSRAITLVESNHPAHEELAQEVLARVLPQAGHTAHL